MATKTQKFIIGFLTLVVLTASVYVLLPDKVRIDVSNTKTTFKVYENNSWVLSGTEYTKIYNGSKSMTADSKKVNYSFDVYTNKTTIFRYTYFKDIIVIDIYEFDGKENDVQLVPVSHEIRVINGKGKNLQYEVNGLSYFGKTITGVASPQEFGHNMKVEWETGNSYSQIFKYSSKNVGKLTVKYKIDSNNYSKKVRLFDPITISGLSNYNSINTNVTQENLYTHLNLTDGSVVLYMPFDVQEDSSNKTYDYSNYSNDGIVYGKDVNVSWGLNRGKFGGGYNFIGNKGYLEIPLSQSIRNLNNSDTGFTIDQWVNRTYNKRGKIVDIDNYNIWTEFSSDGYFSFFVHDSSVEDYKYLGTTAPITNNRMDNYVAVYNKTHMLIYVNGVFNNSLVKSDGLLIIDSSVSIGSYGSSIGDFFNGTIDEVTILNRSLSANEIAQRYNATYSRFYPTGEMLFQNNNFGINNTVNISIPNCQRLNGSVIKLKINSGNYSTLNSSCMFDGYNITGNLTSANLTLQLNSSVYQFYSPIIAGNITLNSYLSSCLYSGVGDWNVLFSDYCNITSPVVGDGNNIIISGTGEFRTTQNITGFKNISFLGTPGQNSKVICINGCFR